ncbi:MAG TPA: M23 family peptidase, partial [Rhodanobacteraceae bacterium]|nr:M23 family peptidase [Rhodanobacteraceae bacterium]
MLFSIATTSHAIAAEDRATFPTSVSQGALVIGKLPPGSRARYADRELTVTPEGDVVFGVGRDEKGPIEVDVRDRSGHRARIAIKVTPRDWPVERIEGVPPETV